MLLYIITKLNFREGEKVIQRKIHHLLESEGEGRDFRYLPDLRAPFDLDQPLLVTEKVDGSTMQVLRGEPWKRFDRFKKGDPRKREVSEAERYELRRCTADDPALKWYLASFEAYRAELEAFGEQFPNRWLYFEALGAKVQPRYQDLAPTIRVFDVGGEETFFRFSEAASMASEFSLPVVVHRQETFGTLENLLRLLAEAESRDEGFPPHQLEGWVLRQAVNDEEVVAKVRVKDLKKLS